MSESKPPKQTADFSNEIKVKIPEFITPVRNKTGTLELALENLLALEKKTRLAADTKSTCEVALAILQLCVECKSWKILNDQITALCKKRAQLQKVIQTVIEESMKFIDVTPDKPTKLELLSTLRLVAAGRIFVELERARMTKILAQIKEAEGNGVEACELLQEVQVETIGAMEAREKTEFLLEQFRLCLAKNDYVRTEIIAKKKINVKSLAPESMADLKLRFYDLIIQFHLHYGRYLDICKAYQQKLNTKLVTDDEKVWATQFKKTVIFLILSPFDAEVAAILHTIKATNKLHKLVYCKQILDQFTIDELMKWPLDNEAEWKTDETFSGEQGKVRWDDFHKRIVQHNIRVIGQYYSRITTARFSQLLHLDNNKAEIFLSEMVTSKQLYAKIDRNAGIISFARKQTANEIVDVWSGDISSLLSLVENTCHLINKENMMYMSDTKTDL